MTASLLDNRYKLVPTEWFDQASLATCRLAGEPELTRPFVMQLFFVAQSNSFDSSGNYQPLPESLWEQMKLRASVQSVQPPSRMKNERRGLEEAADGGTSQWSKTATWQSRSR